MMRTRRFLTALGLVAGLPFTMGAVGDGCAAGSKSPAPDVTGTWAITYDDQLDVEIKIGGSTYTGTVGPQGGSVTITHQGKPLTFDLDCAQPHIICPSEAWPATVEVEQRNLAYEHQMIVTLPTQTCSGALVTPAAGTCGAGTLNPKCDKVCDGEVVTTSSERFGVIGEGGDTFRLYLGAGFATNGVNCALLGVALADANLETTGRGTEAWTANAMTAGLVTVGYAGGCLWAGDVNGDAQLEALVLAASVTFTTGFTGDRVD